MARGAGSDKSESDRSAGTATPSDANPEIQIDCRRPLQKRRRRKGTVLFDKNFSLIGTLARRPWGIIRVDIGGTEVRITYKSVKKMRALLHILPHSIHGLQYFYMNFPTNMKLYHTINW